MERAQMGLVEPADAGSTDRIPREIGEQLGKETLKITGVASGEKSPDLPDLHPYEPVGTLACMGFQEQARGRLTGSPGASRKRPINCCEITY
jgi:hypothetical protein